MKTDEIRAGGRPEILTRELAESIAKMIERMPDAGLQVSWASIIQHIKTQFGHDLKRNVLSQKSWDGDRLVADAYSNAIAIQRRMGRDKLPKYSTSPRSVLLKRIAELEATIVGLQDEVARVRAAQYDQWDVYRITPFDMLKASGEMKKDGH